MAFRFANFSLPPIRPVNNFPVNTLFKTTKQRCKYGVSNKKTVRRPSGLCFKRRPSGLKRTCKYGISATKTRRPLGLCKK